MDSSLQGQARLHARGVPGANSLPGASTTTATTSRACWKITGTGEWPNGCEGLPRDEAARGQRRPHPPSVRPVHGRADRPNEKSLKRLGQLVKLAEENRALPRSHGPGLLPQAGRSRLVHLDEGKRALGGPGALLGRGGQTLRPQPGHLLLRPHERAHPARREAGPRRLARAANWAGSPFASSYRWTRPTARRAEIARQWIAQLVAAIRKHDKRHLITVGLLPFSLELALALRLCSAQPSPGSSTSSACTSTPRTASCRQT